MGGGEGAGWRRVRFVFNLSFERDRKSRLGEQIYSGDEKVTQFWDLHEFFLRDRSLSIYIQILIDRGDTGKKSVF
jgi:hypothetical protein